MERVLVGWTVGGRDLVINGGDRVCAKLHSLDATIALDIVEIGLRYLFWKIRRFLEVHIAHMIQGKRLIEIPDGGRLMRWHEGCSSEPKEVASSASNREDQGAKFHTCFVNSQWKNRWSVVSLTPHLTQVVLVKTRRF